MFYKIGLKNFKGITDLEVDFKRGKTKKSAKNLVLIVGENGVGKSTIVEAFTFLRDTCQSITKLFDFEKSMAKDSEITDDFLSKVIIDFRKKIRLDYLIKSVKTIDSVGPTIISYYGYDLDRNEFKYEMKLNEDGIFEESLFSGGKVVYFVRESKEIELAISNNAEFNKKLNEYKDMYFGKYTLLSCLYNMINDFSTGFIFEFISHPLLDFIKEVENMDIFNPKDNNFNRFAFISNERLLPNLIYGSYSDNLIDKLKSTKEVLSNFYRSFYRNIVGIDYDIISKNNARKYSLVFLEKIGDKLTRIPFELESTGTKKITSLFSYFYEVMCNESTFLIDEIDSGISLILLKNILESIDLEKMKGQLILTTHNLLLLNEKIKKNIYILERKNNIVTYTTLDSFKRKVQPKTDVFGNFVKGVFGGTPVDNDFNFLELLEEDNY